VDDIMIDKVSGQAIYALMSFGGFLGIGENYHPLAWSTLRYDEGKGGYVVNLDKQMLEDAPTYDMESDFQWTPDYGRQVDKYYNAPDLLVSRTTIGGWGPVAMAGPSLQDFFFLAALFFGTFLPFLRASESPMAMACLRLFTLPPLPPRPLFNSPCLNSCITRPSVRRCRNVALAM